MAHNKDNTSFEALLWEFLGMEDPMLAMLEWLCNQIMEAEVSNLIGPLSMRRIQIGRLLVVVIDRAVGTPRQEPCIY